MSGRAAFRKADVDRLLTIAKAHGYPAPTVRIEADGALVLLTAAPAAAPDIDREIEEWRAKDAGRVA